MRIDAHQHYWRYDPLRDTWITTDMAVIRRDFFPEHAVQLLAAADIDGVVAVQASQSEAETDFLLDLAAQHSSVLGVVGWVDLRAPDLRDRLARWRGCAALKGFRHVAQGEPDDFLGRPDVVRGVNRIGEHGYSYDILIYPRQLAAAKRLVEQCPAVRFVLDHCAKPAIAAGEIAGWRDGITRLARHPNVCCKLSGLVTEASWRTWTPADLVPYLDVVAGAFGADRLLFGSDWPVCLLAAEYGAVVDAVARWCQRLSRAERTSIFGAAAATVYRLER
ncbi:MAG: amidohydrolase family protein [Gemmatimonadales bacterium]